MLEVCRTQRMAIMHSYSVQAPDNSHMYIKTIFKMYPNIDVKMTSSCILNSEHVRNALPFKSKYVIKIDTTIHLASLCIL